MHFQIFIPQSSGPMDLASVGLGDLAENARMIDLPHGPEVIGLDGNPQKLGPGKLWTWTDLGCAYYGDAADWIRANKAYKATGEELPAGRYWVGCHRNSPATPEELQRKGDLTYSEPVTDEEGRVWMIPVALRYPRVYRQNEAGEVVGTLHRNYADYFERAGQFWDCLNGIGEEPPPSAWFDFAHHAIRRNYRMTAEVLSKMEILTSDVLLAIPAVALDFETLRRERVAEYEREEQKKRVPPREN